MGQLILPCQQPRNRRTMAPATPVATIPKGTFQRDFFSSAIRTGHPTCEDAALGVIVAAKPGREQAEQVTKGTSQATENIAVAPFPL